MLPISIHAPRTGSDFRLLIPDGYAEISIHAPRTGSDDFRHPPERAEADFNPRSPHGERPICRAPDPAGPAYFNPRSPHGERPVRLNYIPRP